MTRVKHFALLAALIATMAAMWWFVLPPQFGGRTIFFVTKGVSMEPHLYDGDLAVLHKKSSYKAGDIVAYRSKTVNAVLLHRVINVDDTGRLTTRGDNNDFVDLYRPLPSEVLGKLDHAIPKIGRQFMWIKSWPVRIFGAALVAWAAYNLFSGNRRRERPIDEMSSDGGGTGGRGFSFRTPRWGRPTSTILIIILTCAVTVFALTFVSQPKKTGQHSASYSMKGRFAYSAQARSGGDLIYRDGQLSTGDPIYLALVDNLFLTYTFTLEPAEKFKGERTIEMEAVLNGPSGWQHTLPLIAKTEFDGDKYRASAVLDVGQLRELTNRIGTLTAMKENKYSLTVKPTVSIDGTLYGAKLIGQLPSELTFSVDDKMMKAEGVTEASPGAPDFAIKNQSNTKGLNTVKTGEVKVSDSTTQQIGRLGLLVGNTVLRVISLIVAVITVLLLLLGRTARDHSGSMTSSLVVKHRNRLVPVSALPPAIKGRNVIEVGTFADLIRIAETYESLILSHEAERIYMVSLDHVAYRFREAEKVT